MYGPEPSPAEAPAAGRALVASEASIRFKYVFRDMEQDTWFGQVGSGRCPLNTGPCATEEEAARAVDRCACAGAGPGLCIWGWGGAAASAKGAARLPLAQALELY